MDFSDRWGPRDEDLLYEYKNLYWSPPMDVRAYGDKFVRLCQDLSFPLDSKQQLMSFLESIRHPTFKHQLKMRRPRTVQEAVDELRFLVYTYDGEAEDPEIADLVHKEIVIPPMRERQGEDPQKPYKFYPRQPVDRTQAANAIKQDQFQMYKQQKDLEVKKLREEFDRKLRQKEEEDDRRRQREREQSMEEMHKMFANLRLEMLRADKPRGPPPGSMQGPRRDGMGGRPGGGRMNAVYIEDPYNGEEEDQVEEMAQELITDEGFEDYTEPLETVAPVTTPASKPKTTDRRVHFSDTVSARGEEDFIGPFRSSGYEGQEEDAMIGANTNAWANRQPMPMEWAANQQQNAQPSPPLPIGGAQQRQPAPRATAAPPMAERRVERRENAAAAPTSLDDVLRIQAERVMTKAKITMSPWDLMTISSPAMRRKMAESFNLCDQRANAIQQLEANIQQQPRLAAYARANRASPPSIGQASEFNGVPVPEGLFNIHGYINGVGQRLTVDTGAQYNVMPPQAARALRLEVRPSLVRFKGVDCIPRTSEGVTSANVKVGGLDGVGVFTDFVIIDDQDDAACSILLGLPWLRSIGGVIDMRTNKLEVSKDANTRVSIPALKITRSARRVPNIKMMTQEPQDDQQDGGIQLSDLVRSIDEQAPPTVSMATNLRKLMDLEKASGGFQLVAPATLEL